MLPTWPLPNIDKVERDQRVNRLNDELREAMKELIEAVQTDSDS